MTDPHDTLEHIKDVYRDNVRLRRALQTILDMPCPMDRSGDLLAAAQRTASEAVSAVVEQKEDR